MDAWIIKILRLSYVRNLYAWLFIHTYLKIRNLPHISPSSEIYTHRYKYYASPKQTDIASYCIYNDIQISRKGQKGKIIHSHSTGPSLSDILIRDDDDVIHVVACKFIIMNLKILLFYIFVNNSWINFKNNRTMSHIIMLFVRSTLLRIRPDSTLLRFSQTNSTKSLKTQEHLENA